MLDHKLFQKKFDQKPRQRHDHNLFQKRLDRKFLLDLKPWQRRDQPAQRLRCSGCRIAFAFGLNLFEPIFFSLFSEYFRGSGEFKGEGG
jgi:hypothetical protein